MAELVVVLLVRRSEPCFIAVAFRWVKIRLELVCLCLIELEY